MDPLFIDPTMVPYLKAISELKCLRYQFSPTKKMTTILRAASAVYESAKQLQPEMTLGGDNFIDIWVYVVLKAEIPKLPSTVAYLSEHTSSDLMTSEMGYYFTCLEVALRYIEGTAHSEDKWSILLTRQRLESRKTSNLTENARRWSPFCRL